jgi:predicted NAD-dependent protein-ADP-ribosyltransferase YbiA (DUF1768 family)
MTIRFFSKSDRYRDFSNFANYPVKIDGVIWPTTEHYYQAQKFEDPERQVARSRSPDTGSAEALHEEASGKDQTGLGRVEGHGDGAGAARQVHPA